MSSEKISQENYDYLSKQLALSGFGDVNPQELEKKMAAGKDEFSLNLHTVINKEKVDVQLNFGKSKKPSDLSDKEYYFFNSYDLTVHGLDKEGKEKTTKQHFNNYYGNSFTLREGYNLLSGRSVNKDYIPKEGEPVNAWSYIDFKNTTDSGDFQLRKAFNFDLEKQLRELPIKGIENASVRTPIMDALQKGNYQMVRFEKDGQEEKRFLEAAPRYNQINIYDEKMNRQYLTNTKKEAVSESQQVKEGQEQTTNETPKQEAKEGAQTTKQDAEVKAEKKNEPQKLLTQGSKQSDKKQRSHGRKVG